MNTVAILGTAGYTGQETLDRVLNHPGLEVLALGTDSQAGRPATALDPRLARNGSLPMLVTNDEAAASGADLFFWCLSNERAAALDPPADGVVVDLSGAHRIADTSLYPKWYGFEHPKPEAQADWCYALPELQPPTGRLIANPGCYVTAARARARAAPDVVDAKSVVVDAKSGVSGAGRTPSETTLAGSVLENHKPYSIGRHRHVLEMQLMLGFAPAFVPHLLPIRRGLLATCYVDGVSADFARGLLEAAYAGSRRRLGAARGRRARDRAASMHTDAVELGVFADPPSGRTIVVAAEDNLGKGAAGQAMQNANLALGLPETDGLRLVRGEGVSVTAAQGLRRLGRRGRDQVRATARISPSCAPCRPRPARRCSRATACRPPASRSRASTSPLADPQAVVINSGVANAATGERGKLDALASAAEAARLLELDAEEVLVLSTGVIGARLPLHRLLPALEPAVAALSEDGGARRRRGDHDHRHAREGGGGRARAASSVGGMAKGSGMIHPDLATMLAVVTTDYALEAGRGDRVPAAGGRGELQRDLGRRRAVHERLRDPARERRERGAARRRGLRGRAERGVRRPRAAGRRRRRGHHRARRDHRHRRRRRRPGEGDRAPHRDLAAREDGALRPRRQLGPRADGRRLGAVERRLRRDRRRPRDARLQRHGRARRAARRPTPSPTSPARAARSSSTSASARAARATSRATSRTTT